MRSETKLHPTRQTRWRARGMRAALIGASAALVAGVLTGCNPEARGFVLPPGDAEAGRATFVQLACNNCHTIDGVIERQPIAATADIDVTLGGEVTRVRTYGDLVTSIINPSHRLARGTDPATTIENEEDGSLQSRMRLYNDVMTVQQLIDLTEFLQDNYTIWIPPYSPHYFP